MFWGLIMEPQRRYTQVVKRPFHISMASLDVSISSNEPAQVMCGFEGRNYLLCTLRKPDMLQVPLDLNFEVGDELALGTNGNCYVHLTGYLVDDPADLLDEEEDDVEEEEEKEVKKKNKKRNKQELKNGPPSKKIKTLKTDEDEDSEDDSDVDVRALLENTLESDEGDETYNSDDDDDDNEEEAEEEGEEEEELEDELEEEEESSLSEGDSEEEQETVQPQKNKQKVNGIPPKQELQSPKQQKEQHKDKKNKKQQNKEDKNSSIKENQTPKKESPKKLQNGLIVEDIKEGQGQPAKPGKLVTVYYEGRLKSNNKMFDSTKQGQGFSFRLGAGEVIKGWDAGLVGMKVGGKRRITCPPQMAYGAKGSPPVIPGNSTLVFEVELRKLR